MPVNKEWHEQHVMPKRATEAQRIEWHLEHAKYCGCRPIPPRLQEVIERRSGERQP